MKVIFLDIDGVLNADDDFGGRSKPNPTCCGYCGISMAKVRLLEKLVADTSAEIVLVSSWKFDYEEYLRGHANRIGKYLYGKLRRRGLRIADTTDRFSQGLCLQRGREIRSWLAEQKEPVESWVVLDDEIFNDYDSKILGHLVQTEAATGLTAELVDKAIRILLGQEDIAIALDKVVKTVSSKRNGPQNKMK